jgi:FKBP-type peptidyl-prolyl cis-trans isomerase 2
MRKAQQGDHVRVHYVKRFQDGSTASSRARPPIEVIVGTAHPRLPGLGLALVGLAAGESRTLKVPPEQAYGSRDPSRVRKLDRKCFPPDKALAIGKWVRLMDRRGRRLVRIIEERDAVVIVDVNHRWAGLTLELEVELIAIQDSDAEPNLPGAKPEVRATNANDRQDA